MSRLVLTVGAVVLCCHLAAGASDTWTNAEKLNPGIAKEERYLAAKKAAAAGDHEKSYDLLSGLVFDKPADPAANYALGREACATKRYAHAATAFEPLLTHNPFWRHSEAELALNRC